LPCWARLRKTVDVFVFAGVDREPWGKWWSPVHDRVGQVEKKIQEREESGGDKAFFDTDRRQAVTPSMLRASFKLEGIGGKPE